MLEYGARLKVARLGLGLTVPQLQRLLAARGVELSQGRLRQLESRERTLRTSGRRRLAQIAAVLQIHARRLGRDPQPFSAAELFPGLDAADELAAGWLAAELGPPARAAGAPSLINATILFIDLMNSVALSTSLSLWEYNDLINDYQAVLREVMVGIAERYKVGEWHLGGDQLAVFFYDPDDAGLFDEVVELRRDDPASARAAEIEARLAAGRNRALYGALRCAVNVKNAWIAHPRNVARVETDQPVLDVGIGINTGNVVLQQRGDGARRIEGFAINFAKRVEGFSRFGRHCRIMLSKTAYETFQNIVVEDAMLKQRAFFASYTPAEGMLKGLGTGMEVFELKFFHRLAGFAIDPSQLALYNQIFEADPTNIWAYANLINHYLFSEGQLPEARALAERALSSNPGNEKIYYDLAYLSFEAGDLEPARQYALRCVRLNDQMDIAYDLLADIAEKSQAADMDARMLNYRSLALSLSPGSAAYHHQLALVLAAQGEKTAALRHYARAREIFAGFDAKYPSEQPLFEQLLKTGKRPGSVEHTRRKSAGKKAASLTRKTAAKKATARKTAPPESASTQTKSRRPARSS